MDFNTMTSEEIIEYALNYGDEITRDSVSFALSGFMNVKANKKELVSLLRKALSTGKTFRAAFDDGESCGKPRGAHIAMMVD